MPFVGTGHIWMLGILLIIVLIVWGPGKLPEVGSGVGRAIREFRKASHETHDEIVRATSTEAPVASTSEPVREAIATDALASTSAR